MGEAQTPVELDQNNRATLDLKGSVHLFGFDNYGLRLQKYTSLIGKWLSKYLLINR